MAAQSPPFVIQASSHSAALFRQLVAAIFQLTQPGTLTNAAGGVVNAGDLAVTQNGTPNMSVNSAGGFVMIPQTLAANGGLYAGLQDAVANLAVAASNPTNPRIDILVATANDAAYSGATNNWVLQVITGTPAGSPAQPATPASSILICAIAVAANATTIVNANITDHRLFMSVNGVTATNAVTLTNKRKIPRTPAVTQSATPIVNSDITDIAVITGLAQAVTSFTTNLAGTPQHGERLEYHLQDNGTARALTWGSIFASTTNGTLPTSTAVGVLLRVIFEWNSFTSKWECVGVT